LVSTTTFVAAAIFISASDASHKAGIASLPTTSNRKNRQFGHCSQERWATTVRRATPTNKNISLEVNVPTTIQQLLIMAQAIELKLKQLLREDK
jgi:hypothetical protein